jgi:molecular chaperone DnaK
LLLDVTPLTLAIETMGGVATPMIVRNTTVPASKTEVFSTAADNQTQVEVHITQGERPMSSDNKDLGRFILDGIPPAPRGVPQVEVTFDIDANGILKVTAKDKATNKTQHITISGAVGLSDEEVKKMQEEAEKNKAEDDKKKELVSVKNAADALVATAEKSLKDAGDGVDQETKDKVEEKIKAVKESLASDKKEEIESKTNELSETLQTIGQKLYDAANKKNNPDADSGSADSPSSEEKKKDADVEEGEVVS